jgi:hypothetical protein
MAHLVQRLGYGLDDGEILLGFPAGKRNLHLISTIQKKVQTGSGAHPATYLMSNGVLSRGYEVNHAPV